MLKNGVVFDKTLIFQIMGITEALSEKNKTKKTIKLTLAPLEP